MLTFFCGDTGEDAAAAAEAAKAKNFADELRKKMAWDFCIVTPKCSKDYMKELDKRVRKAGFKTDMFESAALKDDEAVLFLRLSVPKARLMEYAAAIGAPARLDPKALRKACSKLNPPINFDKKAAGGQSLSDVSLGQKLMPPFLHIYGPVRVLKRREERATPATPRAVPSGNFRVGFIAVERGEWFATGQRGCTS